jgi:hypothetical protein
LNRSVSVLIGKLLDVMVWLAYPNGRRINSAGGAWVVVVSSF